MAPLPGGRPGESTQPLVGGRPGSSTAPPCTVGGDHQLPSGAGDGVRTGKTTPVEDRDDLLRRRGLCPRAPAFTPQNGPPQGASVFTPPLQIDPLSNDLATATTSCCCPVCQNRCCCPCCQNPLCPRNGGSGSHPATRIAVKNTFIDLPDEESPSGEGQNDSQTKTPKGAPRSKSWAPDKEQVPANVHLFMHGLRSRRLSEDNSVLSDVSSEVSGEYRVVRTPVDRRTDDQERAGGTIAISEPSLTEVNRGHGGGQGSEMAFHGRIRM